MARTAVADAVKYTVMKIMESASLRYTYLRSRAQPMGRNRSYGNNVVFRGEDAILITAEGETAPLTRKQDDWYLKVLINNSDEFIRIDVWTQCHVCPPTWVRNLSPEMKQKHTDNQRHELQQVDIRSLDEYRTKFRDEHNEITKTMKDLSIIQRQAELEEKADNEHQLRKELSMVAQDNDAKHGDVNSGQVADQEDDNLKLQNENIQENKELNEQIQAYFSSTLEILDQKFKQEVDRMAKDAYRETQRYVANLQSIFDFSE